METKVFSKEWFEKHQSKLVRLARSPLGSLVFRFKKMGVRVEQRNIVKITPNSVHEVIEVKDGEIKLHAQFFSRDEYAINLRYALLPLWWAMHAWDFFAADNFSLAPQMSFGFSSLTQNPDASHIDIGMWAYHAGGGVSFASVRGAANCDAGGAGVQSSPGVDSTHCQVRAAWFSNNGFVMGRTILQFDTSSLTSAASISSANIALYGTAQTNGDSDSNSFVTIVTATPASLTTTSTSDWANVAYGGTEQIDTGTRINTTNWSTTGYNTLALNATGQGNISKTGTSKYGIISGFDQLNVANASTQTEHSANWFSSANASNKPQINVTYSTGNKSGFLAFM